MVWDAGNSYRRYCEMKNGEKECVHAIRLMTEVIPLKKDHCQSCFVLNC